MIDLRDRVLRRPIGKVMTAAESAQDGDNYLLGIFDGAALIGCLILQKDPDNWLRLRQVAVEPDRQGQGIGAIMLQSAHHTARDWGYAKMFCHARETARAFYARHGWTVVGEHFDEHGIAHCRMEYALNEYVPDKAAG